jgi:hypothetical protein
MCVESYDFVHYCSFEEFYDIHILNHWVHQMLYNCIYIFKILVMAKMKKKKKWRILTRVLNTSKQGFTPYNIKISGNKTKK